MVSTTSRHVYPLPEPCGHWLPWASVAIERRYRHAACLYSVRKFGSVHISTIFLRCRHPFYSRFPPDFHAIRGSRMPPISIVCISRLPSILLRFGPSAQGDQLIDGHIQSGSRFTRLARPGVQLGAA